MAKKKLLWLAIALAVTLTVIILVFLVFNKKSDSGQGLLQRVATGKPAILADPTLENTQLTGIIRSFGDGFSGLGYINREKTDMFLDYNVTGFSFPPVYKIEQEKNSKNASRAEPNLCVGPVGGQRCLTLKNNKLYVSGQEIAWPEELLKEKILTVNVRVVNGNQGSRWIVGIVTGNKADERGWVYFFNSVSFEPLIAKNTALKIEPKYNRLGGKIYFNDSLDDLLILYSGYDGRAFYYHDGELSDVSRFFGLRVTNGGFPAQIIRTTNSRGSVFYVCSNNDKKFRLIKVWSLRPGELMGSLDLSYLLNIPGSKMIGCRIDKGGAAGQPIRVGLSFRLATSTENWALVDSGFNNSQDWQVVSKNLTEGRNNEILGASFDQIAIYDDSASSSRPMSKLFLANSPDKWQEAEAYSWYRFSSSTKELYWRAVFSPAQDNDYSPWFEGINNFVYKTAD